MTLVFVAKNMQVDNPVGHVNVHPLPTLPAGLSRFHLLRHSLDVMRINLVNGESEPIIEHIQGSGGLVSYHDTYVHSNTRGAGWADNEWSIDFSTTALTWMAVGRWDEETGNTAQITTLDFQSDMGTAALNFVQGGGRAFYKPTGGGNAIGANALRQDAEVFMVFGVFHPSGKVECYMPHRDALAENTGENITKSATSVVIGKSSANFDGEQDNIQYAIAEWNRGLSQSEMSQAYIELKPWLLARGVEIA